MDFGRYISIYEGLRQKGLKSLTDPMAFYHKAARVAAGDGTDRVIGEFRLASGLNQILAEHAWYSSGKPYYKVWPSMIDEFTTVRLDVPTSCLKPPYPTFAIYLPKEPILDFEWDGRPYWVHSLLVVHAAYIINPLNPVQPERKPSLTVWMDVGEVEDDFAIASFRHAEFDPADTIERGFEKMPLPPVTRGVVIPAAVEMACIRLAVAVTFLATGASRIMERDIVKKHLEAYLRELEGSPNRKKWEEKSQRLGLGGWHIGRGREERGLKFARGVSYADAMRDGASSRQLLFQHRRGGHFHTVRKGKGRSEVEVQWFEDTIVRPDLPPRPLTR